MDQTIQVLGVINVLSNGYCCFYVYKTFNIKICLNFIMWFDAAFSSIYSILILVLSWITIFPDPIICSFATFSLFIPTLFYYYNFFSAYIRYKRVSSSINNQLWKTEAEVVKDAIALIGTVMSIDILVVILNSVFDMGWFRFYSICMGKNYSSMSPAFIRRLFHMGAMTSTFFADIKTFWLIRKYNNESNLNQGENERIKNDIPMRASLLNLYMIFASTIVFIIIGSRENPDQLIQVLMISILSLTLPKTPAMVFLTLHVNATNARIDQDAERERKRQLEIQDTKWRRNQRIARQLAMQEEGTIQLLFEMLKYGSTLLQVNLLMMKVFQQQVFQML